MRPLDASGVNRREFLRQTGLAAGVAAASGVAAGQTRGVSIVVDPEDPIAGAGPAKWAAGELQQALAEKKIDVRLHQELGQAAAGDLCIVAAGGAAPVAREILKAANAALPAASEALALVPGKLAGKTVLLAWGNDALGLVYALLELADRVAHNVEPLAALEVRSPIIERPANVIRSVTRCFVSDVEDKPWYNDR